MQEFEALIESLKLSSESNQMFHASDATASIKARIKNGKTVACLCMVCLCPSLMDLPDKLLLEIMAHLPHVSWLSFGRLNSRCRKLVINKALKSLNKGAILLYAAKANMIGITKALINAGIKSKLEATLATDGIIIGADTIKNQLSIFTETFINEEGEEEECSFYGNKVKPEHLTPLSLACLFNSNDVAHLLLEAGANVNAFAREGATPVDHAIKGSNAEMVEVMAPRVDVKSKSVSVDHCFQTILHRAVCTTKVNQAAMTRIVRALLDAGSTAHTHGLNDHPGFDGAMPLLADAVSNPSCGLETIRLLLESGAKADEIIEYHFRGHVTKSIFSYLAQRRADSAASQQEAVDIAKLLVQYGAKGADLDCNWSPLCDAIRCKHAALAAYLIEIGVDPNGRTNHRRLDDEPALLCSVKRGDDFMPITKMLVEKGADIHDMDRRDGDMILDLAAEKGALETVRYLLDKGANIESDLPNTGRAMTPLMYTRSLPCFKLLLERGANPNAVNYFDESVLQVLARRSEQPDMLEATKLVLERGADPLKRTNKPHAFQICLEYEHWKKAELMIQYMPEKEKAAAERQLAEAKLTAAKPKRNASASNVSMVSFDLRSFSSRFGTVL